jgi:lysophospholipase L1-like esterase
MRKYYFIISIVLVIIIVGYFLFGNKKHNYIKPSAGTNIIVFGDSLAFSQGSTEGNDLASLLKQKTGLPVINAGVSGDTTSSALPRLESDVLFQNPKVVIILLGGNDFFQQVPNDTVISNLRIIIDKILATGSGAILVNENKIFASTSLFEDLASEKKIPFIKDALHGIIGNKELMSDTIHPNSAGYNILADKIKIVLEDYLK